MDVVFAGCLALMGQTETEYEQRTVLDFSEVEITGEVIRPEGSYLHSRGRTRFESLIRTRIDFRPELLRSIEQLE